MVWLVLTSACFGPKIAGGGEGEGIGQPDKLIGDSRSAYYIQSRCNLLA